MHGMVFLDGACRALDREFPTCEVDHAPAETEVGFVG